MLKAGIIGLGVGEKHIEGYQRHPDCEVVALCDFSQEKVQALKRRYPGMRLSTDAEGILGDPDIDVVSIASYDNYHYEQIVAAVKAGKHVFVEKPLCLIREEAVSIKKLLDENPDVHLSSNLSLRTCPRFIALKETVLSGKMGNVFYLEGDYLWGRIHKLTEGWRKDMGFYSIIHGAAVHMIDLVLWITGMRPIELQGYGNQIATKDSALRYNDFSVFLMRFPNGLVAKVSANGGCVYPHFHRMAVYGTRETFLNDVAGGMKIVPMDRDVEIRDVAEAYPAREKRGEMIRSFVESILNPARKAVVTTEDVFATMSVCFAAEQAVKEGRTVTIEYI